MQLHFLHFYVSHGNATRFLRGGENYYINFADNLLLFPTVTEFLKSSTFDEVIAKIRHHVFETQCTYTVNIKRWQYICNHNS